LPKWDATNYDWQFRDLLAQPANDLRMFRDVFADHEEGCLDMVRGEQSSNLGVRVALGPSSNVIAM